MSHAICAPACALFDLTDVHVLTVERGPRSFTVVAETASSLAGCPGCGVLATGHGRREVLLHDLPCAGVPVRVLWRKRILRCREDACEISTFSEVHELAAPRAKLTTRAIAWAVTQLRSHDIAVSALAEMLGVAWNTIWHAIVPVIETQLTAEDRLAGVNALGVDEHVWRHVGPPGTGLVTGIVDHSRGEDGRPRARLLDLVPGRTGAAYGDWLIEQRPAFTSGIRTATLDPFHGYANAIRDELPEAITVLDAFHVVKLGGQVVDEVRRRVQQDTLGHRGRAGDPLYGIRRVLRRGHDHHSEESWTRLLHGLDLGDPDPQAAISRQTSTV